MNQEGCSRKGQKVKNFVPPGSLASSRNKHVLEHKNKQNPGYVTPVQATKSNEKHHRHKKNSNYVPLGSQVLEQMQHVSLNSIFPAALTVDEKLQQILLDSTTRASQAAHEQVQQESQLPNTPASQVNHEQMQQHRQDSTNFEANDQSEEQGPSTNKRKRGGTQMQAVHGRSERKLIVLNELNQPIGPTKAVVTELGSFLGTLARNGTFCPLNVFNWKKLKTHDNRWSYIQEKYNIPDDGKKWAMKAIKGAWRGYKTRFKKKHFYAYANDEIRMANRPQTVSESAFKDIIKYWNTKEAKDTSSTNKENRNKLKYPHTVGKTSFAIIREEKKKETPGALSSKDFFVATRRRKSGRVYKDTHEDTTNKIAEMERMETQESEDGTQSSVDTFAAVMGPDHPGRVRLYGRGVTKTLLK